MHLASKSLFQLSCLSVCHVMDHHTSVFYHVYSSRHIVSLVLQIAKPRYKLSILDHAAWPTLQPGCVQAFALAHRESTPEAGNF